MSQLSYGPYRLIRELARGGMGAVHEAVHTETGARYAIKTLLPELVRDASSEGLERFRREAEGMGKLRHPNVARVHAAELSGAFPFLVQDFLPGGTLQDRIDSGPLEIEDAIAVVTKLGRGLQHCHDHGILHRDLKPLNVLFDERGEPQLVDFGLVRTLDSTQRLTRSGTIVGTPSHMAPEQATGLGIADVRTDVYGLGALLYDALTGEPPFRATTVVGTLYAVTSKPAPPPSARRADVPAWLDAVVLRALAKEPQDRFDSVDDMINALETRSGAPSPGARRAAAVALGIVVGTAVLIAALLPKDSTAPTPPAPVPAQVANDPATDPQEELQRLLSSPTAKLQRLETALNALAWLERNPGLEASTRSRIAEHFGDEALATKSIEAPLRAVRFIGPDHVAVLGESSLSLLETRRQLKLARRLGSRTESNALAVHPRTSEIAVSQGPRFGGVTFGDALSDQLPQAHPFPRQIRALAVSARGELAVGSEEELFAWQPPAPPKRLGEGAGAVLALAFTPGGDRLVVARGSVLMAEGKHALSAWMRNSNGDWIQSEWGLRLQSKVSCIETSPDGTLVAMGDIHGGVQVLPVAHAPEAGAGALVTATKSQYSLLKPAAHLDRISALRFSADGAVLFTSCGTQGSLGTDRHSEVAAWRATDRQQLARRNLGKEQFVASFDVLGSGGEIVALGLQRGNSQGLQLWWRDSLFPDLVSKTD